MCGQQERYHWVIVCSGFLTKSHGSEVAKLTLVDEDEIWNICAELEKFLDKVFVRISMLLP